MRHSKTALLVSPQASRDGHGAYHAQKTLQAFSNFNEWNIVFLTGKGFRERCDSLPEDCEIIEEDIDFNKIKPYQNWLGSIRWGIQRLLLQIKFLGKIERIISLHKIDVVLFLDGDIFSIYHCWKRNRIKYPNVAWITAHSTLDFYLSKFDTRGIYKWISSKLVKKMIEEMDSTILYTGEKIKREFCQKLKISNDASERIILTHFGSDPNDLRINKEYAREQLNIPTDAKVVLFFGLLRYDKRLDIAIDSVSRTASPWWLLIAGKPYSYNIDTIRKWVKEKGLYSRCTLLLKYLNDEEIALVFSAADILLLPHDRPYLSNSGPLSMALSYRLPVLAGNVGYVEEMVSINNIGFIANRGDSDSFSSKLDEFEKLDMGMVSDIQNRIARTALKYSFESTVRSYIKSFETAISHRKKICT